MTEVRSGSCISVHGQQFNVNIMGSTFEDIGASCVYIESEGFARDANLTLDAVIFSNLFRIDWI